jgi:UDP-2,3-diacylglucosamine pyrophosphatase LpxH
MREIDTLIISDIHLGSPVCRSRSLLALLVHTRFRKLILNGDIFDDLDFTRLSKDDWALLAHFRELSSPGDPREVIWIAGNHDGPARTLGRLIGVPIVNEHMFRVNGKRCLAIHGHQFDRFLKKNIVISAIASSLYLFVQRIDTKNLRVSRHIKRMSKSWLRLSEKVAQGATWYGKFLKRAEVVFCGHTHREMHEAVNGVDYWNSGCWTDIPSAYITITDGNIELHTTK